MAFAQAIRGLGKAGLFTLSGSRASKPTADFWRELLREVYKIGARSLPIIAVGGAFVGLSVTLLGYRVLVTYGATGQVRPAVEKRLSTRSTVQRATFRQRAMRRWLSPSS